MKRLGVALVSLGLVLYFAGGLSAASITETLTGTISSGIDNAGLFGGGNLAGQAARVVLDIDPSVLAANGLYQTLPPTFEELFDTANDAGITNSVTVNGKMYSLSQAAGGQETFSTEQVGTGTVIESNLSNPTTGVQFDIKVQSPTPYQYNTLLHNPKPFLDLAAATATPVTVDITRNGGSFETQLVIVPTGGGTPGGTPSGTPVPEPGSISLVILSGLLMLYRLR